MTESLNGSAYSEVTDEALQHLRELVTTAHTNPGNELCLIYQETEAGAASLSWRWPDEKDAS